MGKRAEPRQQSFCMSLIRKIPIADFSKSLNSIEKPSLYAWISYQIERKDCEKNSHKTKAVIK